MLTGAAMAAVPARAVAPFATRDATGLGARSSGVGAGRAALARPAAARRPVRAAPGPTRAGEALDWENDDFVPAAKAKKNKKKPKAKKPEPKEAPSPPAAGGEALDWENDDFVPAGKAKKNKKKPKKGGGAVAEAPPAIADPVVDIDEDVAAADAARVAADAAAAAAEAAAPEVAPEVTEVAEVSVDEEEEIEEMDEKALEKATRAAIREAEETERREEEERLAAIDWNAPDEDVPDDGNIIPHDLRDIFAKDARPSKRRTSGTVTNGVRLENVKKAFKGAEVLKGCSWDCKRGERVGLVGWNGAGKTTQLRIITGEMEADEGEVMLADKVKIGYLTQEFEVKETNTVREEFMASFGEESQVIRDTERIQQALENEPDMELMTVLLEKLDELQKKADRLDLFNMERAIDKIMPTLGFVPEDNDRLVASFSGGWQMRISLGKILLQEPGLLLMDEPTNHLDLDAIQWLEGYLTSVDVPMVIVSHDREFLDQLCTKTVEVERGRATTYKGNYSDYQRAKRSQGAIQMVAYEKYMKEVTRQKDMIRRLSGGGQSGRANAAAKELERLREEPVEKPWIEKERRFRFPDAQRSSAIVARVENLTHGYDEKTLFKNTNLQIDRGERVAMIGANGCGKSTLMRLMQGAETPVSGTASLGDPELCKVNYFYQNQAEGLDANKGVLETLVEAAPDEQLNDLKALLGQMKFSTSFHKKPVKFLSGGEKARLALAKFMVTPANVLLLDEPTNHLDIPSKEMLEEAISNFDGSVIAISHDRYFLRQIATRVLNFDEGKITDYAGDYAYFLEKNDKAGSRDKRLQKQAKEVEKKQIVSKSKMSKAEKAKLKKEKAKAFGGGSGAAKKNKNAGRWN